ncbi:dienelactone hydrolase family protein [Sulfitobacter mediterraneus]|uniref:dienelactone hydrolase family protein n=1 Tax=Sulfitobacter mediterraneus TaxID=83219 RepID=UPI0021A5F73C|nr:dienelactone hydrolase family protein [Sulfitobacter mediterraneus]UWR13337.1 dienelactone hydrolase family protein [Sulfitobacter mediterraneus]
MQEYLRTIDTADGPMGTFFAVPAGTPAMTVAVLYMDVFGLREELFDLARAYAQAGHIALIPDLFHRRPKSRFAPVNGKHAKLPPDLVAANVETTMDMVTSDTRALIDDVLKEREASTKLGGLRFFAVGYCMGGRHALAVSAQLGEVVGGISAHGGMLVTQDANSPHLLVSQVTVPFHFAFAVDDPTCPYEHQQILRNLAAESDRQISAKLYDAAHGWTFPTRWSYDADAAAQIHALALSMMNVD